MCTALKTARHTRGWTKPVVIALLREAGARAGVQVAAPQSLRVMLAGWENGHCQPSPAYQRLLCEVHGRSPAQLGFTTPPAGTGGETCAWAALLYVAPLATATLATVTGPQARFYAGCVLADPACPDPGELSAGYQRARADAPPWLDLDRARVAARVARPAQNAPGLGPGQVPSWLRAHRLHGCGLAAQLFVTG